MKLGIVYHMPFWQTPDGAIREVEGSFARYVDSLAPYADEIRCACRSGRQHPRRTKARGSARRTSGSHRCRYFDGPRTSTPSFPR